MQAADDVKFGCAFADALVGALINFVEGVSVGAGRVRIAAERAELTVGNADVGRIDVTIDVVVGDVAVFLLADIIGEPADGEKVGRAIKLDAFVEGKAFAGADFVRDGFQSLVAKSQFTHFKSVEKFSRFIRAKARLRRPRTKRTKY